MTWAILITRSPEGPMGKHVVVAYFGGFSREVAQAIAVTLLEHGPIGGQGIMVRPEL